MLIKTVYRVLKKQANQAEKCPFFQHPTWRPAVAQGAFPNCPFLSIALNVVFQLNNLALLHLVSEAKGPDKKKKNVEGNTPLLLEVHRKVSEA